MSMRIFAEHSEQSGNFHCTIEASWKREDEVCVKLNHKLSLNISKASHQYHVLFSGLFQNNEKNQSGPAFHYKVASDECEQLSFSLRDVMFDLTKKQNVHSSGKLKKVIQQLQEANLVKCIFCSSTVADISGVTKVEELPGMDVLDTALSEGYFCHNHDGEGKGEHSHSHEHKHNGCKNNETDSSPRISHLLTNGVDILCPLALLNTRNVNGKVEKGAADTICCQICGTILGKRVHLNDVEHVMLLTSQLSTVKPVVDIDGDKVDEKLELLIRRQDEDTPLSAAFFSMLMHNLLQEKAYRLVLIAAEKDSSEEFSMLWLMNHVSRVYHHDNIDVTSEETLETSLVGRYLHKILYQVVDKNVEECKKLVELWNHDMAVQHIVLPRSVCVDLLHHLTLSTVIRPKNQQFAQQGFMIGGILKSED